MGTVLSAPSAPSSEADDFSLEMVSDWMLSSVDESAISLDLLRVPLVVVRCTRSISDF